MNKAQLAWRARFISVTGGMETCNNKDLAAGTMTYVQWRKANVDMFRRVMEKKITLLEKSDGNH